MRIELSAQSIDAIAEIISGGSAGDIEPPIGVYRQGWKIEAWFKAFGVPVDLSKESRLAATKTALSYAAFVDASDLLKRIIERAADPRDFVKEPERHTAVMDYLNKYLVYDGLRLELDGRSARLIEISMATRVVSELSAMAAGIDFDTVSRDLDRALHAADTDPEHWSSTHPRRQRTWERAWIPAHRCENRKTRNSLG